MGSKSQAKTKGRGKAACQGSCSADEVGHALLNLSCKIVCNHSDVYVQNITVALARTDIYLVISLF